MKKIPDSNPTSCWLGIFEEGAGAPEISTLTLSTAKIPHLPFTYATDIFLLLFHSFAFISFLRLPLPLPLPILLFANHLNTHTIRLYLLFGVHSACTPASSSRQTSSNKITNKDMKNKFLVVYKWLKFVHSD